MRTGVNVNGSKLYGAINDSAFNFTQIADYIGRKSNFIHNVRATNRISEDDLCKICALIKKKPDTFKEVAPTPKPPKPQKVKPVAQTYEPPVKKPMTAREDPNQNWMVNIYCAIEDMNDRLDIMIHEMKDQTAAIRGLAMAIKDKGDV